MHKVMFSKKSDHYSTPIKVYEELDKEFHFDYDPCPLNANFDGLKCNWGLCNFINPPYSNIKGFMQKGLKEFQGGATNVFLVPSRTDTRWFHEYVLTYATEIRFIKGRLKFGDSKNSAPFPSMIVVYKNNLK